MHSYNNDVCMAGANVRDRSENITHAVSSSKAVHPKRIARTTVPAEVFLECCLIDSTGRRCTFSVRCNVHATATVRLLYSRMPHHLRKQFFDRGSMLIFSPNSNISIFCVANFLGCEGMPVVTFEGSSSLLWTSPETAKTQRH